MFRRFLSSARMLAAVVAVGALGTSAKADLTITISQGVGSGSVQIYSESFTFGGNNYPSTLVNTTGAVLANGGYSFSGLTLSATGDGTSTQSIQLSGTLTGTTSASDQFEIRVESPSGQFSIGGATGGLLTQSLTATFTGANNAAGSSMTATGSIIGVTPAASTGVNAFVGSNSHTQVVSGVPDPFGLLQVNNQLTSQGAGSISFTSITTFSVPEPASVIAGLMGLPCVAGLVGVARRRLGGVELVA